MGKKRNTKKYESTENKYLKNVKKTKNETRKNQMK